MNLKSAGALAGAAALLTASEAPAVARQPEPSAHDLADAVIAFALAPSTGSAGQLPLADQVRLGLGADLVATRSRGALAEAGGWLLEQTYFRAYIGPFSALRAIRNHYEDTNSDAVEGPGAGFTLATGPACPGTEQQRSPRGLEGHRRISLQPSVATYSTCLMWFSVDLYLNHQDQIEAITLDLWEP